MNNKQLPISNMFKTSVFLGGLTLSSSSVFAVSVNGSVGATSVPSLSGSMLVVLSLLLFAVAFRLTKQNKTVNKFFITLLGVGMVVSMGSGVKLISKAQANNGLEIIELSSSGTFGGAPNTPGGDGYEAILQNNSGQAITITFTPNAGDKPSACFLEAAAVKPTNLAAASRSIPDPCGNATSNWFNPGVTTSVTIYNGERCFIDCSSIIQNSAR